MNITELKEKLTTFNKQIIIDSSDLIRSCHEDDFIDGAKWQHSEKCKTILALIDIVEDMQKCLKRYEPYCVPLLRPSTDPDMDPSEFDEIYEQWLAKETLTTTEQKLKNLTEET